VHDSLVTAAFSGLFLLKMANLFPAEVGLAAITSQVEQLANLLSEVAAERYPRTLVYVEAADVFGVLQIRLNPPAHAG
jgi:hypothetical protein